MPRPKLIGRPLSIDAVLRHVQRDGETVPITVADNIIELVRGGNYIETAAHASGVSKDTVHRWLKEGARVNLALHNDGAAHRTLDDLTETELRLSAFSDSVMRAQAEAEAQDVLTGARLARGGITVTTITEKVERDNQGNEAVVSRVTKTETTLPDSQMVRWRLQHRNPDTWGRERLEVTGEDGDPIELTVHERRAALLDALDVAAKRIAAEQEPAELIDAGPLELEAGGDR